VRRETVDLILEVGGQQEAATLNVIPSPAFPLVLGMPWLARHGDGWGGPESATTHPSLYSATAHPAHGRTTTILPEPFRDLAAAFAPPGKAPLPLPPLRPGFDMPIELEPGSRIPFGHLRPLIQAEGAALDNYIPEMLAAGLIRPSTFPAGAPVVFAPKADGSLRLCSP
jgi:hypothetical protein